MRMKMALAEMMRQMRFDTWWRQRLV